MSTYLSKFEKITLKHIGKYSIKDLEVLSGVKAHSIRIWEQRYGLLKPSRTDTNIRYYDDEQLKRLLNVSLLLKNGMKISRISQLDDDQLNAYLLSFYNNDKEDPSMEDKVNSLIISMIELNEDLFEKIFSSSVSNIGFEGAITKLIYPFLDKVGILWSTGDIHPAQEHFISNLIRQKIIAAIDGQSLSVKTKSKFLLFLPEGELHEIGLLLANYMLRQKGHPTIYLGQNVPMQDVEEVYKMSAPDKILLFITTPKSKKEIQAFLKALVSSFKETTIYVSGNSKLIDFTLPRGIKWLKSVEDFKSVI